MSDHVTVPLRSERLDLEPLRIEHAAEMAVVLGDPSLHTFIGGAPASEDALRARYARMLAGSLDPEVSWCNWVLRSHAESVLTGTVQATLFPAAPTSPSGGRSAEVAWVVGTDWQGRGFASEAARTLVAWLRTRDVTLVVAHVHPAHRASAAVAAAAGLSPTDVRQDGEVRWELCLPRG
ncbi:GNAT family N-acetyltransferase [Streptomyces sp. NPDC048577]|uniref:GNAT family N-acetyltransferase n=1 Tax=Streptomyces sp. NPDC048577 TaxID=3157209 RepID=UPI003426D905